MERSVRISNATASSRSKVVKTVSPQAMSTAGQSGGAVGQLVTTSNSMGALRFTSASATMLSAKLGI